MAGVCLYEMRKIFIENKPDESLALTGEEHLHVSVVLRARAGDELIVCCGDGYDYHYEIVGFERNKTKLKFLNKTEVDTEPKHKVDLFIALTKGDKLELITQKCVELGINSVQPFTSEYVQVKGEVRFDRLNRIAKEAAQQCGRGKVPSVGQVIGFSDMVNRLSGYDNVLFFYEGEGGKIGDTYGDVALIVGSEGGFSKAEAEILSANACTISLGKRILRAETAAITATALAMYELGDLE